MTTEKGLVSNLRSAISLRRRIGDKQPKQRFSPSWRSLPLFCAKQVDELSPAELRLSTRRAGSGGPEPGRRAGSALPNRTGGRIRIAARRALRDAGRGAGTPAADGIPPPGMILFACIAQPRDNQASQSAGDRARSTRLSWFCFAQAHGSREQ